MNKFLLSAICFFSLLPAAKADIVVGVSVPLSGPAASVSEVSLPGAKQAVADINAKGGVKGEQLKLEIFDDVCDPKQAVQAANKLIGKEVVAVLSLSCSGAALAAAPVLDEEGLPFLAALASSPDLTKHGYKTLFRPSSRDDQDALAGVDFIARKFAGKKIAIVDDKTAWGIGMGALVAGQLKEKGFTKIDRFNVNGGDLDFSSLISRLKAGGYDVVYPAMMMREAGLLVRQMKDQSYKPVIVGSMTLSMPDFAAIAGEAKEGLYFTRVPLTPQALALAQKLNPGNVNAGIYNIQSYAAVEVLAQAIDRAGTKPASLLADMHNGSFTTLLGNLKFTPEGDVADMKFELMQYKGGQSVKAE